MFSFEGLNKNFQFLVIEIKKQLEQTYQALDEPDDSFIEKVTSKGDYVDNLKNIITRKSYKRILKTRSKEENLINAMMSLNTITSNMEKIGDYCEAIVKQTRHLNNKKFMKKFQFHEYFRIIFDAIDLVMDSLFKSDVQGALEICRAEYLIDQLYEKT
jgi:Na+/phosphate symporter